jgi:hypothetical protein
MPLEIADSAPDVEAKTIRSDAIDGGVRQIGQPELSQSAPVGRLPLESARPREPRSIEPREDADVGGESSTVMCLDGRVMFPGGVR